MEEHHGSQFSKHRQCGDGNVITVRFPVPYIVAIGAVVRLRPCNPNLSTGIFWVGVGDLPVCQAWRSGKRSVQVS